MVWTFGLGGNATQRQRTGRSTGKPFDPTRVERKVPLGSTQTWLLRNPSRR